MADGEIVWGMTKCGNQQCEWVVPVNIQWSFNVVGPQLSVVELALTKASSSVKFQCPLCGHQHYVKQGKP